jgi:plastocyanin
MHLLRTRRGLLLGFVVLALVGAACGKAATASENGGSGSGGGSGTSTGPSTSPSAGPSGGSGGNGYTGGGGYGGGGSMMAATVLEGPNNGFTFSPSTVTVNQGQTITLTNVSDAAHTFTVTGQGIDVETMPGKTAKVTIDLPPGTYPFVCRFHESMGMKGTLVVRP